MGSFKYKSFSFISLRLLLLSLFITNVLSASNPLQDVICESGIVFCGEGRCEAVNRLPGFDCKCNPGWTKFNLTSSFQLPPCVLPNCTINYQCGNGSPPPPPPPPPPPQSFQFPNFSDPCMINLCGPEGTCQSKGSDFICQCSEGSANLLNNPKFPCFKKCSLGADCHNLDLGFNPPTSPPPTPPANSSSSASGNSSSSTSGGTLNGLRKLHLLSMIVLATIFLIR